MSRRLLAVFALWIGSGCLAPVPEPLGPAPRYQRADGAFDALDLDRDVLVCADRAREHVGAAFTDWRAPPEVPRRALRDRTSACMVWKGWAEPPGPDAEQE
ncbi:MAG: hypothetical protein HRU00_14570 [Myxococcales bacterium]|nr:hypothetical protein [Myxococcales bacterium]